MYVCVHVLVHVHVHVHVHVSLHASYRLFELVLGNVVHSEAETECLRVLLPKVRLLYENVQHRRAGVQSRKRLLPRGLDVGVDQLDLARTQHVREEALRTRHAGRWLADSRARTTRTTVKPLTAPPPPPPSASLCCEELIAWPAAWMAKGGGIGDSRRAPERRRSPPSEARRPAGSSRTQGSPGPASGPLERRVAAWAAASPGPLARAPWPRCAT